MSKPCFVLFAALLPCFCSISAAQTPLGTQFTYQGRLNQAGQPFNGTADLQFDLYDSDIGGNLLGTQSLSDVAVTNGLFTVTLNSAGEFGGSAFAGDRRWLEITVNGTALSPRQELTAAPFSHVAAGVALPFSGSIAAYDSAFKITNTQDFFYPALHGDAPGSFGIGIMGEAASGTGVYGYAGNAGVYGVGTGAASYGVYGTSNQGEGVHGHSGTGKGVYAFSGLGYGLHAIHNGSSGVSIAGFGTPAILAESGAGNGVMGVVSTQSGAGLIGIGPNGFGLYATSTNGYPIYGYDAPSGVNYSSFAKPSVLGESLSRTGVMGISAAPLNAGVLGYNPNGYGMYAQSGSGFGLHAYSATNSAIRAVYSNFSGLDLSIFSKPAVLGESNFGNGILGAVSSGGAGVVGYAPNGIGVYGYAQNYVAVQGITDSGYGLYANASGNGIAIYGLSTFTTGQRRTVLARNNSNAGIAVQGWVPSTTGTTYGVIGQCDSPAGWAVWASGDMGGSGLKAFVIDHPFDPENKTLRHYCAEGPEPQNIYNGVATTDASGYASIALPDYFDEINRDFRYQLTVIDAGDDFVLAKVVEEVRSNRFRIRTSRPEVKVSWEVKGIRNDRYVRARGFSAQADKSPEQRGTYLQPALYGQPPQRGQFHQAGAEQPAPPAPGPDAPAVHPGQ